MMIGTSERLAQLAADREAVDVRQAEVEQDEVGAGRRRARACAGRDALDVEALRARRPFDERLGDRVLVLDDEQLHASSLGGRSTCRIGRSPQPGYGFRPGGRPLRGPRCKHSIEGQLQTTGPAASAASTGPLTPFRSLPAVSACPSARKNAAKLA